MAQRYRTRPSDILGIRNSYDAYCFDEVCDYILDQLKEGKRPFFKNGQEEKAAASSNMETVEAMKELGAEVKTV